MSAVRNLLSLVGLVVVVFVGCGWYFKWYQVSVTPGTDGKQHIAVEVDTKQIGKNLGEAKDTVGKFITEHSNQPAGTDAGKTEFVGPPAPAAPSHTSPVGR